MRLLVDGFMYFELLLEVETNQLPNIIFIIFVIKMFYYCYDPMEISNIYRKLNILSYGPIVFHNQMFLKTCLVKLYLKIILTKCTG